MNKYCHQKEFDDMENYSYQHGLVEPMPNLMDSWDCHISIVRYKYSF